MSKHSFGQIIRAHRKQKRAPLRVVAAAVEIDSTMLSKIECGKRLPTDEQVMKFAKYFRLSQKELAARTIADKFLSQYGQHPAARNALILIKEGLTLYTG